MSDNLLIEVVQKYDILSTLKDYFIVFIVNIVTCSMCHALHVVYLYS